MCWTMCWTMCWVQQPCVAVMLNEHSMQKNHVWKFLLLFWFFVYGMWMQMKAFLRDQDHGRAHILTGGNKGEAE